VNWDATSWCWRASVSLKEIEQIQRAGRRSCAEVFVHGALCVAYSGQCLTSESARWALRQPWRMRAGLPHAVRTRLRRPDSATGRPQVPAEPARISAGLELLPELARAGSLP